MINNDITALLYRIKENIRVIENGNVCGPILDEVRSDFLDLLELIKLFLISERDSYYGYFLMNMQFRANFYSNCIAGIKLNEFPPVLESNPLLLCKFTLKEIIYVICHEIDHVLLNHPAEMVKANPDGDPQTFHEFNLAADASVNDRIDYEISAENHAFLARPDGAITSRVLAKMYSIPSMRDLENYAYYFGLIHGKSPKDDSIGRNGEEQQNGQESILQRQNEKDGTNTKDGRQTDDAGNHSEEGDGAKHVVTADNCGGQLTDHDWEAGADAEDATAVVKEIVNAAVDMMNDETRGMMPGHFMSQVARLNKPPVLSWQAILKKYIGTITANKRKTRTRLNRRQPERFDLSGSMDDKVLKLVVAIDTSASVDDKMIAAIFNEIFAILAKRKHDITVIECDADVRRVYKVRTPADVKMKVAGRGGTSFTPVIEYINDDKYFRDALLIYFTDGYGEREIPRPRTYRNLWVVFEDERNLSLNEPYGVVLKL